MKIHRLRSYSDYCSYTSIWKNNIHLHWEYLRRQLPSKKKSFTIDGYSYPAKRDVHFLVDYKHSGEDGNIIWRERVCCPITGFNNRMRAIIHFLDIEAEAYPSDKIYITEQITPLFKYLTDIYPSIIGSEYLGDEVPFGNTNYEGILNESICDLQFPDNTFDLALTFDVLEHVPDYKLAFNELYRILKKGGKLIWTVPFAQNSKKNIVLAKKKENDIIHFTTPQYHGDPLSKNGILCFTIFGWEMLNQILNVGFIDSYAATFFSQRFGYLGGEQFIFVAKK